jgi:hypothetical protein
VVEKLGRQHIEKRLESTRIPLAPDGLDDQNVLVMLVIRVGHMAFETLELAVPTLAIPAPSDALETA